NHGRRWQRLANELPLVAITDLVVAGDELVAATQGRAFWSFDGLPHLRQLHAGLAQKDLHVFTPVPVAQFSGRGRAGKNEGVNPATNMHVRFYVGGDEEAKLEELVTVEIKDVDGKVVYSRSSAPVAKKPDSKAEKLVTKNAGDDSEGEAEDKDEDKPLEVSRGMNNIEITWKEERAKILEGMILWSGRGGAARVAPGDYTVTVTVGEQSQTVVGRINPDPRTDATIADLQARYRLVRDGNALVTEAHEAIESIRSLREQMAATVARMEEGQNLDKLKAVETAANDEFTSIEETLYQTKSKSRQDPLNYPIKLTDKLLGVLSATNRAEFGPTNGQRDVAAQLSAAIKVELARFKSAKALHVDEFNKLARALAAPHIK
ncbi:MAG: hypothetical protein ACI91B_004788, partial [Planctomycetota bacterium]